MNEGVLGNDWNVNDDENEINNNYEPFDDQEDDDDDESHDFGIVGDNGIDHTVYS